MLHNLIANLVLRKSTNTQDANIAIMTVPFKSETIESDPFAYVLQNFVPGFLFLIYILPVYNMVFLIVKEKESRTKESMRMMGMSDLPYWLSWFVYYTFVSTTIATVSWGILCINCIVEGGRLYVWVWFWLYG
jgi:ABC-type Na+ efflux pump permease subunit